MHAAQRAHLHWGPWTADLQRWRALLLSVGGCPRAPARAIQSWFEACTQRIDALHEEELRWHAAWGNAEEPRRRRQRRAPCPRQRLRSGDRLRPRPPSRTCGPFASVWQTNIGSIMQRRFWSIKGPPKRWRTKRYDAWPWTDAFRWPRPRA